MSELSKETSSSAQGRLERPNKVALSLCPQTVLRPLLEDLTTTAA